MWHSLTEDERKLVTDALRSSKGDRPATEQEEALADRLDIDVIEDPLDAEYRAAADDPFGDWNIDDDAVVSHSDEGAYVHAWKWVDRLDSDRDEEEAEDDGAA